MSHYERERELHEAKMRQKHGLSPYFEQESYTDLQEQVVVYAVLAYNGFSNKLNNIKGVFDSQQKAELYLNKFKAYADYEIVEYVLNQPT